MYEAASNAGVLDYRLLEQVKPFLSSIKPRTAVFDHNYVKKIDGPNVKKGKNKMDLAEQLRARHPRFQEDQRRQPPDHHLVRFDRVFHRADRGAPVGEGVREGAAARTTR